MRCTPEMFNFTRHLRLFSVKMIGILQLKFPFNIYI
uniref:Uncharacterized protein n=1 Tax=Anguilla anguilla TaxID=7936 RepID=A0A0E9T7A8_ANGAN